jgi:hypothetical protein
LGSLAVPITSTPLATAIWTANWPTPPEAPWMSTRSPAWMSRASTSVWYAVRPASGTAPASSNDIDAGFRATVRSGAGTSSADVPNAMSSRRT